MTVLTTGQIAPDGVPVDFPILAELPHGSSFFLPCIDVMTAIHAIRFIANKAGVKVAIRSTVENDLRGIRVWRY